MCMQVLHAGQRLAVELPEVEVLRASIRRSEWSENAKKVCPGPDSPSDNRDLAINLDSAWHVACCQYAQTVPNAACEELRWPVGYGQLSCSSDRLSEGPLLHGKPRSMTVPEEGVCWSRLDRPCGSASVTPWNGPAMVDSARAHPRQCVTKY